MGPDNSAASAEQPTPNTTSTTEGQTFGQKAVGLSFNPSGDDAVTKAKQAYADVIDQLNNLRTSSEDPEVKRLCSVAITEAQGAQMWAVKAVTWKS